MTDSQRRATERVPFLEDVKFVNPRSFVGKGIDIGAGGIGVLADEPMEIGTPVEIEIFEGHATAYGKIRWCGKEDGGYRLGVQFREEDWVIMEIIETLRGQEG